MQLFDFLIQVAEHNAEKPIVLAETIEYDLVDVLVREGISTEKEKELSAEQKTLQPVEVSYKGLLS